MKNKFLSFVFPETTKKQIDAMPAEMKLKFYVAVTDYGMYGIEPEDLTEIEKLIWIPMKDLIDSCKSARGGAPEGNHNAKKTTETTQNKKNNQNNVDFEETTETTLINDNGNDKGNGNDNLNHNDNADVCAYSFAQNDIKPLKTTPADANKVIKQAFEVIQTHNSTHGNMHKMPISKTYVTFLQKEGRQLCELFRDFDAADVLQALNNYLRVANIDTWKSTFSFSAFCKNCIEYTPEYFSIDKYEKTDFSKDADNKPVQRFKERMSQDSRFDIATFLQHSEEWLEKGRPEGEAYFALQEEWYRQEDAKAVNYDS